MHTCGNSRRLSLLLARPPSRSLSSPKPYTLSPAGSIWLRCLAAPLSKFSKVSALLHLLYQATIESTFQYVCLAPARQKRKVPRRKHERPQPVSPRSDGPYQRVVLAEPQGPHDALSRSLGAHFPARPHPSSSCSPLAASVRALGCAAPQSRGEHVGDAVWGEVLESQCPRIFAIERLYHTWVRQRREGHDTRQGLP